MPIATVTYRRTDLYEAVWSEPLVEVAKRYGVSDVAIGKVCRKLRVPLPGRGYWARRAAGHDVRRLPLPTTGRQVPEELTVRRRVAALDDPPPPAPNRLPEPATGEAIEVAPVLEEPHRLVQSALKKLSRLKPNDDGRLHCWRHRCLKVMVSPAQLDRALRIMDALIKSCEERKLRVEITPAEHPEPVRRRDDAPRDPLNTTRVLVDGEWIELSLVEQYRVERDPAPKPPKGLTENQLYWWTRDNRPAVRHIPTGILDLTLSTKVGKKVIRDYKRRALELRLHEAITALFELAAGVKKARAEAERRRLQEIEESKRRWEAAQREAEDRRRLEDLQGRIERRRLANDIREYIGEAQRIVDEAGCRVLPDGPLEKLIIWGRAYAERIDPLEPLRKEVAGHVAERERAAREQALPASQAPAPAGPLESPVAAPPYGGGCGGNGD